MDKYYVNINGKIINQYRHEENISSEKIKWDQHLLNELENKNIKMYASTFASINVWFYKLCIFIKQFVFVVLNWFCILVIYVLVLIRLFVGLVQLWKI